jgi:hypothetical protein
VSGQVESRNMGVIVPLKLRFVYRLEKHGITHDDPSSKELYNNSTHRHKVIVGQKTDGEESDFGNHSVGHG